MRKKMRLPRVVVADDFPHILDQIEKLLRDVCEIVAFARDGGEALARCSALHPDILLLDLSMPVLCGFEVARRLRESGCKTRIIFVTVQHDRDYVEAAFSLGAAGYVLKCRIGIDLRLAIEAALKDCTFTSPFTEPVSA